jgi:hypothetical protein
MPVEKVINCALADWLESVGEGHIEEKLGLPEGSLLTPAQDGQGY